MERVAGFLLDIYPVREGMVVWVMADDGRRLRLVEEWRPRAYLRGEREEAERVAGWIRGQGAPVSVERRVKLDFMSGGEVPAWELRVGDARGFGRLMSGARARFPLADFYDADIPVDRMWFYETRRHPLARVDAEIDGAAVRSLECRDSIWDLDYEIPPFTVMGLRVEGPALLNPAHGGRRGGLEVHTSDGVRVLDTGDPGELLSRLAGMMREADPDLIVTERGDGWLLPILGEMQERTGIPLPLNRDPAARPRVAPSRSYFTYGRIMHTAETWILRGRLHFDRKNSFTISASGFDGLYETSRLARIPVQACARTSTGTGISSMQVARAVEDGILVPVDKKVTEGFLGADELLEMDKGGLVFQPEPGLHEGVGELDFASMYPSIMVRHNLSPETMDCPCCRGDGERVPESPLWSCRKRVGLIPRVLAPLLAKRARYKALKASAPAPAVRERAKARSDAHKWMLVCCFGYLGYRNARFGRIEAHEATTAWGRETLLKAKETAEGSGFRVLHAIVDCLWVVRDDGVALTEGDCAGLAEAIGKDTGIPVSLEGIYRWLAFLPSRADEKRGVAQRYMGVFGTGEVKARGIEARRGDTPPFVRAMQERLLGGLAQSRSVGEARTMAGDLRGQVEESLAEIRSGRVRKEDLAVFTRLSRGVKEYSRPTPGAVAAQQLYCRGVKLEPGQSVGYVFGADRPMAFAVMEEGAPYDAERYAELVRRAANTVLNPFGVTFLPSLSPSRGEGCPASGRDEGQKESTRPSPPPEPQLELFGLK